MRKQFSGWKEGLPYYGPVMLIGGVAAAVLASSGWGWIGGVILAVGTGMLLFFRDFPRTIKAAPEEVLSPADGTVVAIEDLEDSPHYDGPTRRVSIFLSVLNVHVNRIPYEGVVRQVKYIPGQFMNAMKPETTDFNEANALWLDTPRGLMTVRQISGAIARRIVCPVSAGESFAKGEKYGMIRFGSRTELYLPPGTQVCVKLRDKVNAGLTVIARF